MKKIKIAFVGCGKVANHYKSLILKNPIENMYVVSACDSDISKAKELAQPGISQRKIAKELSISLGAVNKYLKI